MFRFVPDNVGGVGSKRKQTHKPCESCKKRHKRCPHAPDAAPTTAQESSDPPTATRASSASFAVDPPARASSTQPATAGGNPSTGAPETSHARTANSSQSPPHSARSDGAYLVFFSHVVPQSSFVVHGGPEGEGNPRRSDIGIWLGQKSDDQAAADEQQEVGNVTVEPVGAPAFRLSGLEGLKVLSTYIRRECMSVLPPAEDFDQISSLYYSKFDPIYPILHGENLDEHEPMDRVVLKQCICLVAALDPSLKPHLRLGPSQPVISQAEFRTTLATIIKQSLDSGFVRDRMAVLQATALMAFHGDRENVSEVSPLYCAQAVCLTHGMALHLGWPGDGNSTPRSRRIFWCIWTLDRLCATINGRAFLFHDKDNDHRVWDAVDEQIPAFRLLIRISSFIDIMIMQYRPSTLPDYKPERAPSFEDLVREANAGDIHSSLLVTLELYYLAILILQSRPPKSETKGDHVPSSSIQSYCANSVLELASGEYKRSMSYWVTIPYAVSMACSVAYKTLRSSPMSHKRKEAYATFQRSCDILDELSKSFASAKTVARLAKETLHEVERVSASRSKVNKPTDLRREQPTAEAAGQLGPNAALNSQVIPPGRNPGLPSGAETLMSGLPGVNGPANALDPAVMPMDTGMFNEMDFTDVGGIFDDFDPNFQLNRVDALFTANLNPTMPLFPADWLDDGQYGAFNNGLPEG